MTNLAVTGQTKVNRLEAGGAELMGAFDGEPANYVAAVAATATYTGAGAAGSLLVTAVTAGASPPTLDLVKPDSALSPLTLVEEDGDVTVNLETDEGDNSSITIGTGNGELTVTAPNAGAWTLNIVESGAGGSLIATSGDSSVTVSLAMDLGTAAEWTITDAGTGADSLITVTGPSGEGVDPTDFDDVTFESKIPSDVSQLMYVDESEWPNVIIWLPTDTNGDVTPTACSAIATALGEFDGTNFIGADWTFTPAIADGDWNSYNAPQNTSTAAVAPAPLTTGENSATAVAAAINVDTDFTAVAGGTGADDVAPQSGNFTGGGANSAILTTLAELKELLNESSTLLLATTIANGSTKCTDVTISLPGGVDHVIGTPAVIGRLAVGFAGTDETAKSAWIATKYDPYGTVSSVWTKFITGS
jgi:hypothetical protein